MTKFTRTNRPDVQKASHSRFYGNDVSVGEPLQLQVAVEMRQQVESSLEILAKERLMEAESQALAKANAIVETAKANALKQSQEILEKANAQAKALVQTAQEQESQIRDTAYEEGFKSGFQEGYSDATTQVEQETVDLLTGMKTLVDGAHLAEKQVLKNFEAHALQLIEHIACKVLHRELSASPETLLTMIDHAVESLYLSGKVRVVVSTQIIQELRQFSAKTNETLDSMRHFEFVGDPALDLHQLYIIGQEGSFELSPATQARQLIAPLEKNLALPCPENDVEPIAIGVTEADELDAVLPATELPDSPEVSEVEDLESVALDEELLETFNPELELTQETPVMDDPLMVSEPEDVSVDVWQPQDLSGLVESDTPNLDDDDLLNPPTGLQP